MPGVGRSTAIYAFCRWRGPEDGMILPTVSRIVVLGCPGIRVVSRRISFIILADPAMRGIAISFSTLARVVSARSFLRILMPHAPIMISRRNPCSPVSHSC